MKRPLWETIRTRAILLLLVAHVIWVVARVPHSVFGKRIADVQRYRSLGAVRFQLDGVRFDGAEWIQWVLDNTPEDAVVLYRGRQRHALEFVPALIFPRLLWAAYEVPADATTLAGRPIARGEIDGLGSGQLVLVGRGDRVELELR